MVRWNKAINTSLAWPASHASLARPVSPASLVWLMSLVGRVSPLLLLALSLSLLMWSGNLVWSSNSARATHGISSMKREPASLASFAPVQRALAGTAQGDEKYEEYAFYHQGGKWVRSWFQCDRQGSVALMLDSSTAERQQQQHYLAFDKSHPAQKHVTTLALKQDADCGMQKCWWTFISQAPEAGRIYAIEESHYFEPGDGYWTRNHRVGTGASEESAISRAEPCRWFLRTRASVITDRRSLYVTETKTGRLVLRIYDYKPASNQPALFLTGGESSLNAAGDVETFVFKNRGLTYMIKVSTGESRPLAEVSVVRRNAVSQRDDCLSYTYLKKS